MLFSFTEVSTNSKTGPMPVVYSSKDTCPKSCPLKKENGGGCYASVGTVAFTWNRLDKQGLTKKELLKKIGSIRNGRIWRMNIAGDLVHKNGIIDADFLNTLIKANKNKRGFCYSHHDPSIGLNAKAISAANKNGFTVNLSADNLNEADKFMDLGIAPVVTVLPSDQKTNTVTPKGRKVIVCPNFTHNVQCIDCGLCQKSDRSVIVGFPAHGIAFKKVDRIFREGN